MFKSPSSFLHQLTGLTRPDPDLLFPGHVIQAVLQHPCFDLMKFRFAYMSYSFTFHCLSSICKMSYDLGETDDQEVDASGARLAMRVKNRGRDDGMGPKFVSGKSINEYFPVMTTSLSPLQPGTVGNQIRDTLIILI